MSYRRTYHGTVSGTVSGSFSYPKSESGGSRNVSLSYNESVTINIDVDTDPVDQGIASCRNELAVLERSIQAGSSSQVMGKAASAEQIAGAVTRGFNGLVFSEIDQKLLSFSARIQSATALLAAEIQEAGKREIQFTSDFQRIKERYASLFNTINADLDRRVRMLDEPAFNLVRKEYRDRIAAYLTGAAGNTLVYINEIDVSAGTLAVSLVKSRIISLLDSIRKYLANNIRSKGEMAGMLRQEKVESPGDITIPAILVEKSDPVSSTTWIATAADQNCPAMETAPLRSMIGAMNWVPPDEREADIVNRHFLDLIERDYTLDDPVQRRKADLALQLLNKNPWLTTH